MKKINWHQLAALGLAFGIFGLGGGCQVSPSTGEGAFQSNQYPVPVSAGGPPATNCCPITANASVTKGVSDCNNAGPFYIQFGVGSSSNGPFTNLPVSSFFPEWEVPPKTTVNSCSNIARYSVNCYTYSPSSTSANTRITVYLATNQNSSWGNLTISTTPPMAEDAKLKK